MISFSSSIGFIHTVFACLALLTGLIVVLNFKGTKFHKYMGYFYFISMLALNISALYVHALYVFGPFHWLALFSLTGLLIGISFPLFFRHKNNWLRMHSDFMLWSYIGLLAAFVAESMVRISFIRELITNREIFWYIVIGSSLTVMAIGAYLMEVKRPINANKA